MTLDLEGKNKLKVNLFFRFNYISKEIKDYSKIGTYYPTEYRKPELESYIPVSIVLTYNILLFPI